MRFAMIVFECTLLLVVLVNFQAGAQQSGRPDIVLATPNTIRIESLDDPKNGHWVVMPGFAELGSPTFSRGTVNGSRSTGTRRVSITQGRSAGSPGAMARSSSGWLSARRLGSRPTASGSSSSGSTSTIPRFRKEFT